MCKRYILLLSFLIGLLTLPGCGRGYVAVRIVPLLLLL